MVMLDFEDSVKLLEEFRIPHSHFQFVKSKAEAVRAAKKLKFPVVMKVASDKIVHKFDVGAVRTGLDDVQSVERAFDYFHKYFRKEPIIVQRMVAGVEVIIGGKQDLQFGPTVVFGLGGIFVEIIKDFSLRVAPIGRKDALSMIDEIKSVKILQGARNTPPVDISKLADILLKVSRLMVKHSEIKELDLNPVVSNHRESVVVDVRVMV